MKFKKGQIFSAKEGNGFYETYQHMLITKVERQEIETIAYDIKNQWAIIEDEERHPTKGVEVIDEFLDDFELNIYQTWKYLKNKGKTK